MSSTAAGQRVESSGVKGRRLVMRASGWIGVAGVVFFATMAILAPVLAQYDPTQQQLSRTLRAPGGEHILGTDRLGRDVLSRIVHGSRVSLVVSTLSVLLGAVIGVTLGIIAGYFTRFESVIMRAIDILMAFPTLLLAIAIVALFGRGFVNLIIAIGISNIPDFVRLTRAEVRRVATSDYVSAGSALGASSVRLILRHIVPNIVSTLIILATLRISVAILTESSLSFLGLGLPPPMPSWGVMLAEGQRLMLLAPWLSVFPGLAIAMLVLSFNLLGDGLRDALDPRLRY